MKAGSFSMRRVSGSQRTERSSTGGGSEFTPYNSIAATTFPRRSNFDAIISVGGPMSVNDEPTCPWLVDEKRVIREERLDWVPSFQDYPPIS